MKIQWMKRRSVAALATGAVALATFGGSQSGLLAGLFEKDRCELPKRVPCGDCSFGYSRTSWRPWGTCCETQAVPVHVPGGGYSPLDGMPYSTIPAEPHDGSRVIIESTPYHVGPSTGGEHLPPILSDPPPGVSVSPAAPQQDQLLPPEQAPFAPDVRSIDVPTPSRPGDVPSGAALDTFRGERQQSNQYRGPVEDPIRGLLPGTGYSPQSDGRSPATDSSPNSLPPSGSSSRLTNPGPTFESPPFTSAPRQSQPETDYSEYIPLPNADSAPKSLTLPNPADRGGNPTDSPRPTKAVPERETPADSAIEVFDPGTLPLPESGTRPATSSPADPGVTQLQSAPDPYADFQVLPSIRDGKPQLPSTQSRVDRNLPTGPVFEEDRVTRTSAERVNRQVQELTPRSSSTSSTSVRGGEAEQFEPVSTPVRSAAPEAEYSVPDWKPLSDPSKTYRSVAPQRGNEWRTMQTPTGNRAPRANSQQRPASQMVAPPWKSRSTSSTSSGTLRSQRTASVSQPSARRSAGQGSLPSVETLLSGEQNIDSRPARVVQETLYDVIDVDRTTGTAGHYSVAALDSRSRRQPNASTDGSTADWSSIRAADGNAQSTAQSSRLTQ